MIDLKLVSITDISGMNGVSVFCRNFLKFGHGDGVSSVTFIGRDKGNYKSLNCYDDRIEAEETNEVKKRWSKDIVKKSILNNKIFSLIYFMFFIASSIVSLRRLIDHENAECVYFFQDCISVFSLSKQAQNRTLLVLHSSSDVISQYLINIPGLDSFLGRLVLNSLLRKAISRVDKVATLGCELSESINQNLGSDKAYVVPNGVPRIIKEKTGHAIPTNVFRICFVGSVIERKGVDILIDSLIEIGCAFSYSCDIYGSCLSEFAEELIKKAKCYELNVEFHGNVNSPFSRKSYDVFVLPSRNEGLPLSIIEAASVNIPIIATDVGSIKEIFSDAIIYTNVDAKSLCEKISFVENNRLIASRKAKEANEIYNNRLSFEIMKNNYLKIINKV